jgi:hypothetical protein
MKNTRKPSPLLSALVSDVFEGLKVFRTLDTARAPDGSELSDATLLDRARNIVAGLIGNYRIAELPSTVASDARAAA